MRRLFALVYWLAVVVACWPRVRCDICGARVWGWSYRRHVFGHVAEHARAIREAHGL